MAIGDTIRQFSRDALSPAALGARLRGAASAALDAALVEAGATAIYANIVEGVTQTIEGPQGGPDVVVDCRGDGGDTMVTLNFYSIGNAAADALSIARRLSPPAKMEGSHPHQAFRDAWIAILDGMVIEPPAEVPWQRNVRITITNTVPYARKIEIGRMRLSIPPGIVEQVASLLRTKYPHLQIETAMISVPISVREPGYDFPWYGQSVLRRGDATKYPAIILTEGY